MILYFADRKLNIIGQASTKLPKGLTIVDDKKTEDIETGVAVFECTVPFDDDTRDLVENCAGVGNYILRSYNGENEFYTIIDSETDTKNQEVYIYAEDAGLDLLNEIVGAYEADKAYSIAHYIEKYTKDSGFTIGVNEVAKLTRKLSWDSEQTVTERIASIATQFDGAEVSYSFAIDGMNVASKFINIYKERGKDIGANLRLNKEIDRIITKKSIANIATALQCTGATPEQTTKIIEVSSDAGSPKVLYTVSLKTKSRTASSAVILATVSGALQTESDTLETGYVLTASIYMGGSWHKATLKAKDKSWKGTTRHSKEFKFTISGIPAGEKTFSDIKFAVSRGDSLGGSAGILAEKTCGKYVLTNYIQGGVNGEGISERPMTLEGYSYDDGDFYVDGTFLKSRAALEKWRRFGLPGSTTKGHLERPFSFETLSQSELCTQAITELKKLREIEVNYEVDINKLPDNTRIGDRINIIDDVGNLYVSARVLKLETSAVKDKHDATLGEYLIKGSGISQKVAELAAQFAKTAQSVARALAVAQNTKELATEAKEQADEVLADVEAAQEAAQAAQQAANNALESASNAQEKATAAQDAVADVQQSVSGIESTIENAQTAANNAQNAANTAQQKADEAAQAAAQAVADAADAKASLELAQSNASTALEKADNAKETAEGAKVQADNAKATADAAKLDAEKAKDDIASLGDRLDTVSRTMEADYARKTDLSEAEAHLQTQITQNAAEIISNAKKVQRIDETANNAQEQLIGALAQAEEAQRQADDAQAEAESAQAEADEARLAATAAQNEADTAKAAADTAGNVADKAEADLKAAQEDLENISSRADATEEEIAIAQQAVTAAQTAAETARANAQAAATQAAQAQSEANAAAASADLAKRVADDAADKATIAQLAADSAKGNATQAQAIADQARAIANDAQAIANTAKANAENVQAEADQAAADAATAQKLADDAGTKAEKAAAYLARAQQDLADVLANVDATEDEVAEAEAAVDLAQTAAEEARIQANTAQAAADLAKSDAEDAQAAADAAILAAEEAQANAFEAWERYDEAKLAVDGLAKSTLDAETQIRQNADQIELRATKREIVETLGGYSTKEETEAAISLKADEITQTVSATYTTKEQLADSETQQRTDIVSTCESMILSATEKYVETSDYEEFRSTVSAQLQIMSDEIIMNFTTNKEQIAEVDGDLQSKFTELYEYISFAGGSITLGSSASSITFTIENDLIVFKKNGVVFGSWDGDNFYTGNIVVRLNERAQIGNFAYIPRSDGSLMFVLVSQ